MLDVGCGTGFHLPRFATTARSVVGVEPHPDLLALARRRTRALPSVTVHQGTAQALPLPEASVDVVHARWAYFFGPGCEPGLAELSRVVRRGGVALVVDNDPTRSTFGGWFRRGYPDVDPTAVELVFSGGDRGWKGDVPVVRIATHRIRALGWANRYDSADALRVSILAMLDEARAGRLW